MRALSIIGKSITRIDSKEKATGKAMYVDDFKRPRMLYGRILGSPYPHAKIIKIDTSQAKKVTGVRAVITADDVPMCRYGGSIEDQYILPCDGIVRKVDEPVAAVAAESIEAADEAISLIEVDYEELPAVLTMDEAHSENPPSIIHSDLRDYSLFPPMSVSFKWHPDKFADRPNVVQTHRIRNGDIDKGFKEADVFVENTYETNRGHHAMLETSACIAWVDPNGIIHVMTGNQAIFMLRTPCPGYLTCPKSSSG